VIRAIRSGMHYCFFRIGETQHVSAPEIQDKTFLRV
jgi:hypothetical protein